MTDITLVSVSSPPVTVVNEPSVEIVLNITQSPITLAVLPAQEITVISITQGMLGPEGPPGPAGEEDMPYADRTDFVSENLIYRAQAAPGTADTDALWRIRRLTVSEDGDVTTEWADGDASFTNVWADRAALTYT